MKKIFSHPPREANPTLWRSLEEREGSASFAEGLGREFSDAAAGRDQDGLSRRDFVRLMGAATALTGGALSPVSAVFAIAPALAEGRALAAALEGIARQPDAAGPISRTLFVGLAMIETMAIYCLVVALLLLFANPFAGAQ